MKNRFPDCCHRKPIANALSAPPWQKILIGVQKQALLANKVFACVTPAIFVALRDLRSNALVFICGQNAYSSCSLFRENPALFGKGQTPRLPKKPFLSSLPARELSLSEQSRDVHDISAPAQNTHPKGFKMGTASIGACAMTTQFLDNIICIFEILLSWRFPRKRKQRFWMIFLSAPKAPPPLKSENSIFIVDLPSLTVWDGRHSNVDSREARGAAKETDENDHFGGGFGASQL